MIAPSWMEHPGVPTVVNLLAVSQHQCPMVKDIVRDVPVDFAKVLPSLHSTLWLQKDVLHRQSVGTLGFFSI